MKIPRTKWRTRDVRDVSFDFVYVYHFHTGAVLRGFAPCQEVYGHSASVVRNTVWVLGGKNQAGKRISVSLSRSSTAAMGCQWPVLECWLIIPMWEINISGNALVIKKPSVIETLGSTIVGHQKFIMFMSPVSGTCFSKVLLREPVMSCQTSSFNNSAIWGTFLDQFIRRIKIMALLLQTCTHQNPQSNVA